MADLGNLMFRMGLNTKDFEKQMQDELTLAKKTAEEIKKAFADIKLPTAGGKGGKGGAGGGAGGNTDELKVTDDLYKKLANRIGIVNEQMQKLRINARFGYNGQYVQDAIDKLDVFKEKLQSGLLSGKKSVASETMKLFSNQDYALLNKQVENLIREGDKYNRSLDQNAAKQKKAAAEHERELVSLEQLRGQYNKLADAINKVNFAQSHTNKSGVNAGGALTNNARTGLLNAQAEITRLINLMTSGGSVSRSQLTTVAEQTTRAIRESSTAIQQQRAINTEAQRQQMQGQAQILARQRAINAAQAENARLIARSNSNFSIMRNLVGQVGSMMGMYFSVYALQNFIQDLVRIRGEFDMQYTALKAILQSGQQASELFSQLKTLAPISPYQFKDLATYAKQLSAYSIPYNELFDTTKRLADLSSGLGVDFYRIVLAYGQVRSAAVLRGQELRQFTEAGIPMVDELAKKFTKLKGEVVSAGDVFELISERQVPFQMVKEVIDDLTNEGGKFYMMQEKQSETLKGKVSNLADRYDIMMNSLGEANDGVLKGTVDALAAIMEHANLLVNAIGKLAAVWGFWKLATTAQTAVMGKNISAMTAEEAKSRVKQANILREAQLYRELSAAEKASLAKRGTTWYGGSVRTKLSSNELGEMAMSSRITQNEALRLAYLGKINRYTLGHLAANKVITQQQMQQVLLARQQAVSWLPKMLQGEKAMTAAVTARLALMRGMSGLMSGLGAIFSPTNLAIAGVTALITAYAQYREERDKMAKDAAQIATNAKENYEEIRKFIADNPIEIAIKSGDDASMRETVKRYVEEIQKAVPSPLANNLVSSIYADKNGKERGLQEQVNRAKELAEAVSLATQWQSEYNRLLIDAADKENGIFSDSLQTDMKDAAEEFQEFRTALYGIDKVKILNTLQNEGLDKMGEEGKMLAQQLADGKSSMEAIFSTVTKMYAKSAQYNKSQGGMDNVYHFDRFLDNSGLRNVIDQYFGSLGTNGYVEAAGDMTEQAKKVAENFKTAMQDAGINPMTDAGRIYAEQLKKSFFENVEISDEHIQNLFSFTFDSTLYGTQATAFKMLGTELGGALTDGARQAVQDFKETGEWSVAMEAAVNEAKDKVISKYPELKDELEKAWQTPQLEVLIRTELAAQKLESWKKYMMDVLGDKYDIVIKMTTNVKEAQEAIQKVYDDARAFITKQKPLQVKLGVAWNTKGIKGWLDSHKSDQYGFSGDATTYAIMQQIYKAFQTVDEGKVGVDKGWISTDKADKKDKPKGGSQKDKYTEDLKRRYESFKKAISEYNKAIKSMGEAESKALVKTVYGIELPDKYISKYGGIALAEDFEKKNTKKTDAAKNFRETLRNDKTSTTVQKATDSYDALADAQMENIKLTEKQYKDYDELFKKTGDAKLSSILAFGSETKPYKDMVEYLKAELVKMGQNLKVEGISFDKLLGLSPQEIDNLQPKIKELFTKIKEAIATDGADVKKQLEDVFNKTDDEDVKIALNNNLRDNLLSNLPEQMKGATPEAIDNARQVINDYYNKLNKELNLEKIKKSINWTQLFGNITEMSIPMLDRLEKMLQKIVDDNNDLDPEKMKEWVTQLNKVKEAKSGINNVFDVIKSIPKRNLANKTLTQTNKEVDRVNQIDFKGKQLAAAYDEAIVTADTKTQKEIEQTEVIVQLIDAQGKLQESTMTYSDLLKRQSSDQNTSQSLQNAANKASNSFFTGAAATIFSKIGTKAAGAGASGSGGGGGGASSIAIVDAIIQVVNNNLSNLSEFMKTFGTKEDSAEGRWAKNVEKYNSYVYGGWEKLKSGNVLGAISDTINGWGAGIDVWKSDTEAIYQEEKERYNNLVEVWDTVISRLEEVLDESSTENIASTSELMKQIYQENAKDARTLGKDYLNSGAKTFSHSHGVDQRDDMSDTGWSELARWARYNNISSDTLESIRGGRMDGLFSLSVDQLKTLQEQAPHFYAALYDDTKTYIQQIIDAGENLEDLEKKVKELYTATTTDAIADSFASALDSMDDQTKTFADNFTKTIRNAIINAYVNSTAVKDKIQKWYDKAAEYASNEINQGDSVITDWEKNDLLSNEEYGWNTITEGMNSLQKTMKALGVYNDQTSGSLSGGIKSITEETADLLASYVNAIRADVAFIRTWYVAHFDDNNGNSDTITQISVAVANIEANTRRSADNTDELVDLLNAVTKATTNGKAFRVA